MKTVKKFGFTLIELLIVVSIIGTLSAIGILSYRQVNIKVRDSERSLKIEIIKAALDKYYESNGEYPGCNAMSQSPDTISENVLAGTDPDVFTTPGGTSGVSSIIANCGDLTTNDDLFAYIGDSSSTCSSGNSCSEYTLKYFEEKSQTVVSVTN